MTAQIDLARSSAFVGVESNDQRPAEKVGIDGELDGLARLAGKKNFTLVIGAIGRATFSCAAFPHLNFHYSLGRATGVAQLNFERKRASELKNAMEADPRFEKDFRLDRCREKKADENKKSEWPDKGRSPRF